MPGKTNNLKDKLEENQLDLSLMSLTEVPVSEISELPKGTHLDLSHNLLTWLPEDFGQLTHVTHLDLSKNQVTELPEYFGQLKNLKWLDLSNNLLTCLPVSFSQLKNLKWLDLKNNPLETNLSKAAGPCITPTDCSTCAKRVVSLMQSIQSHQERERQKQLLEARHRAELQQKADEAERERIRAEKKAAKERRRREREEREEAGRKKAELEAMLAQRQEMQQRKNANGTRDQANVPYTGTGSSSSSNCLGSLLMVLLATTLLFLGFGASLIWVYTGGHMDQRSIERALPIIQKDMDMTLAQMNKKTNQWLAETRPYTLKATETFHWIWSDIKKRNEALMLQLNTHLGPYFLAAKNHCIKGWYWCQMEATKIWNHVQPHFNRLIDLVKRYSNIAWKWLEQNVPIYMNLFYVKFVEFYGYVQTSINEFMK